MKLFIKKSTILTLVVLIIGGVLYSTVLRSYYIHALPFLLLFFYVFTNLVHGYLLKVAEKPGARFTSQYMAGSFIKMFFYIIVAVVYVIVDRENAKIFIVNFLLLYLLFTAFEVTELRKIVRQVK